MRLFFITDAFRSLPAKRQRLLFVLCAAVLCCGGVLLVMAAFRDNIIYFYTPSELQFHPEAAKRFVRIGGLVEIGTVRHEAGGGLQFVITDGHNSVGVRYTGIPPDLFREGQGVIAEGTLDGSGTLAATRILAKHDENYMPKGMVTRLKQSGYWRGAPDRAR